MIPIKVKPLHNGSFNVQEVTLKTSDGSEIVRDRIRKGTTVAAICHDVVNGHVILVSDYQTGAMQTIHDLPQGNQGNEDVLKTVQNIVKSTTGCEAKSAQIIQEFMRCPETDFNPTILFYCTVDSREALDSDNILAVPSKQLIREVSQGFHESQLVIMAGWYLKMLNKGLEK